MSTGRLGVYVVGGGRMAAAYTAELRKHDVRVPDELHAGVTDVLVASFSGKQTLAFLEGTVVEPGSCVVDLTTQTVKDAKRCENLLRGRGCTYFAGGVTGGERQVGSSDMTLILGSAADVRQVPSYVRTLGDIVVVGSVEQAVAAKLLHNFVLIIQSHALGAALRLADGMGIHRLADVLDRGTAGRRPSASSVARDFAGKPISSYSGALAAKDLDSILDVFPLVSELIGIDVRTLAEKYRELDLDPYTTMARTPFRNQ